MGLGKKKTYVNATITNLYTQDAEEMRMAYMAILEATMNDTSKAPHIASTQLGANGVKFRNYCYWAREYKFSDLHNEDIGEDDRTWVEMLNYYEPQVSVSANLNQEDITAFLKRDYEFNDELVEKESYTQLVPCKDISGSISQRVLTFKTYTKEKYEIVNTYCGKYFYKDFGEAYLWSKEEYFDKFKSCIYTKDTTYNIVIGYGIEDDEGNSLEGSADDIYIQFGYTVPEKHEIVEGEGETEEDVFYTTEEVFVPLKTELNINNTSKYLCISAYIYTDTLEEQYEKEGDFYLLDENYQPKPTGEYTQKTFKYTNEKEGYEGNIVEEFESTINIDEVRPVGLIISEEELQSDPIISNLYEDPGDVTINLTPPICLKNNKQWLDLNNNPYWFYRNKAVCRKIYTSFTYYQELLDNLYEPCSNADIGWVYLMYGLPTNMVQLDYCARYALQFFKQLAISDWSSITPGMVTTRSVGKKGWQYGSHTFNFHFNFSIGGLFYQTGIGKCPAKPECRRGECGFSWFGGNATLWRQWDTEAWEMLQIYGYSTTFIGIKNGKSAVIGSDGWTNAIWKNEATEERNYSKAVIPISAEVAKNVPLVNWTDLTQYIGNIGVTSYKVVKIKWYQTGIFKVIVIVITIVVTIVISIFAPEMLPASMLSFGSIVGAGAVLLNILLAVAVSFAVAVIVNALLTPLLTDIFGEFWGNFFAALIAFTATTYFTIGFGDSTFWTSPYAAMGLVDAYNQASMAKIQAETTEFRNTVSKEQAEFDKKYSELAEAQAKLGNIGISRMESVLLNDPKIHEQIAALDMSQAPFEFLNNYTNYMTEPYLLGTVCEKRVQTS